MPMQFNYIYTSLQCESRWHCMMIFFCFVAFSITIKGLAGLRVGRLKSWKALIYYN